ncbi:MAG TPA: type II toxin-antitoxin system VapC family toxin [Bryobacteraceae bacterium]|nr:type II toxin-antitoxin system VapC family toxin [Bryobacteraceae bacterium]
MTGFLLDTNVLSEFKRRGDPDPHVSAWLTATDPDLLWASVLSFGEIRKGIQRLAPGKRRTELEHWLVHDLEQWFEERLLPITKSTAERWGVLVALSLDKGSPLSNIDGLIAATAVEHGLTLVTRNVKDFAGLGLSLLNPWTA